MTQKEKNQQFRTFVIKIYDKYCDKNQSYGDSFNKNIQKFGMVAGLIIIYQKLGKLETMISEGLSKDGGISLDETISDIVTFLVIMSMSEKELINTSLPLTPTPEKTSIGHSHINIHYVGKVCIDDPDIVSGAYGAVIHFHPTKRDTVKQTMSGVFPLTVETVEKQDAASILSLIEIFKILEEQNCVAQIINVYTSNQYIALAYKNIEIKQKFAKLWEILDSLINLLAGEVRIWWTTDEKQNVFYNEAALAAAKVAKKNKK